MENRFRAATLFGKLANLAGDLDSKWLDNTAMFKAITGGDTIQAEHKYGAAFDFTPWALPFYSTNKAFGSADSSEGWVARWVVVPFPNSFIGREDRDAGRQAADRRRAARHPAPRHRGAARADGARPVRRAGVAARGQDRVRDRVRRGAGLAGRVLRHRPRGVDPAQGPLRTPTGTTPLSDGSKTLSTREFYNRIEQINGIRRGHPDGVRGFAGVSSTMPGTGCSIRVQVQARVQWNKRR